jgi:hypothetical protein
MWQFGGWHLAENPKLEFHKTHLISFPLIWRNGRRHSAKTPKLKFSTKNKNFGKPPSASCQASHTAKPYY